MKPVHMPTSPMPLRPIGPMATEAERQTHYEQALADRRRARAYEDHVVLICVCFAGLFGVAVLVAAMVATFGTGVGLSICVGVAAAGYATHRSAKRAADRAVPPIK